MPRVVQELNYFAVQVHFRQSLCWYCYWWHSCWSSSTHPCSRWWYLWFHFRLPFSHSPWYYRNLRKFACMLPVSWHRRANLATIYSDVGGGLCRETFRGTVGSLCMRPQLLQLSDRGGCQLWSSFRPLDADDRRNQFAQNRNSCWPKFWIPSFESGRYNKRLDLAPRFVRNGYFFSSVFIWASLEHSLQQLNGTVDLESIYIHITTAMHSTPIFRMDIISRGQTLHLNFPRPLDVFLPSHTVFFWKLFCVHGHFSSTLFLYSLWFDLFSFSQIVTCFTTFFEFSSFTYHFCFGNCIATSAARTFSNDWRRRTFPE